MARIIVSACLIGCDCRYTGDSCRNERIISLSEEHTLIPVCPEQLGGLTTPRNPSEIIGDRVVMNTGRDVTTEYKKGAACALLIAKTGRVDFAVLKANSPSCGKGTVYDGTFSGKKCSGNGVTAALFIENEIPVFTEHELDCLPL